MNKPIYVAFLNRNDIPGLIKVFVKKDTPKLFVIDHDKELVRIIGNSTPRDLHGRQLHKQACHWRYTAQEALELLRELTTENVQIKKIMVRKAESEHGYIERFRLTEEEQDDE